MKKTYQTPSIDLAIVKANAAILTVSPPPALPNGGEGSGIVGG